MELYCEKCSRIFDGNKCPVCSSKKIRAPKDGDLVFLAEKESIWSDLIEGMLKSNGIAYIKKGSKGAAFSLTTGPLSETFKFLVPYDKYIFAGELLEEYFQ